MSAPKPSFLKLKASRIPSRQAHDLAGFGAEEWDGTIPAHVDTAPTDKAARPKKSARAGGRKQS
jgi:hypothetical protein